jgi:hypothetical protein
MLKSLYALRLNLSSLFVVKVIALKYMMAFIVFQCSMREKSDKSFNALKLSIDYFLGHFLSN